MPVYSYEDANGEVRQTKERAWVDGKKRFFWHSRTETGWVDTEGDERYLYHLPEVLEAQRTGEDVYVCEGEKDADALRGAGCIATTPPDNGAWPEGLAAPLAGAGVWVCYDNDAAGHERGWWAVNALRAVGARLRGCLRALVGKDVADHLAAGHGVDELVEEDPPRAVPGAARRAYGGSEDEEAAITRLAAGRYKAQVQAVLTRFAALASNEEPEVLTREEVLALVSPRWRIENWIREKGVTLLWGLPGACKSTLADDWADQVLRGGDWHGFPVHPGGVLTCCGEGWHQYKDRLAALDGVRGQLNGVPGRWLEDTWDITNMDGLARLVQEACKVPNLCMVVIDPVLSYCIQEGDVEDTRGVARAGRALADGLGISVVLVQHANATGLRARGTEHLNIFCDTNCRMEQMGTRDVALTHHVKNRGGPLLAVRMLNKMVMAKDRMVLDPQRGQADDEYTPDDVAREQLERKEESKEKKRTGYAENPDHRDRVLAVLDEGGDLSISVVAKLAGMSRDDAAAVLYTLQRDGHATMLVGARGAKLWYKAT